MKRFVPSAGKLYIFAVPFVAIIMVNSWIFSDWKSDDNRPKVSTDKDNPSGEIIFEEDFSKHRRGTKKTANWEVISVDHNPNYTSNYEYIFEVNSKRFLAKCLMGERTLQFDPVDISNHGEVVVAVDIHSRGLLNQQDFIELVVTIDEQTYRDKIRGDVKYETLKIKCPAGAQLDMQLNFRNNGYYESYGIDNVKIYPAS